MRKKSLVLRQLTLAIGVAVIISAVGCSSSKKKEDEASAMGADENIGDSDSNRAMGLQTIRFPYDASVLDSKAKAQLAANAAILKEHANTRIQIEGHCDQRGGIQYNIALGERRANAVRSYLVDLGVSGERMTVISFGKEKLIDQGMTEDAHARNRRANFVVTAN